eukprot:3064804-Prymnesium_polylepis.1
MSDTRRSRSRRLASLAAAEWKLVLDVGAGGADGKVAGRRWPLGPNDFDALIETIQAVYEWCRQGGGEHTVPQDEHQPARRHQGAGL